MCACVYTSGGEKSPRPPGSDTSSTRVTSPSREGPLLYYYPRVPTGRVTWSAHAPIPSNFRRTRHPNSRIEILDRVPSLLFLRPFERIIPISRSEPCCPFLSCRWTVLIRAKIPANDRRRGNGRILGSSVLFLFLGIIFLIGKKGKGGSLESVEFHDRQISMLRSMERNGTERKGRKTGGSCRRAMDGIWERRWGKMVSCRGGERPRCHIRPGALMGRF